MKTKNTNESKIQDDIEKLLNISQHKESNSKVILNKD